MGTRYVTEYVASVMDNGSYATTRVFYRYWENPTPHASPADRLRAARIRRRDLELASPRPPSPQPRSLALAPGRTEARPRERRTAVAT